MQQRTIVFLVTWVAVVVYLGLRADRGWIPHDEGLLAQSAERVLQGEIPHRDFDDTYTGGLAYLHALAFELFGLRLTSLRWMLLVFSAAFVAAIYALAVRVAPPLVAGAVTWAAIAWSLPLYFAGLPSWYNLFFATFGTLALARHLDDPRRRWLFAAGLCAGLSCLMKLVGLYFVAAVLLFLLYRHRVSVPGTRGERWMTVASATGLCALVTVLVTRTPGAMAILHFLVPVAALCGVLLWTPRPRAPVGSHGGLGRLLGPFLAGLAVPILGFLVPYVVTGSVGDLLYGVFVLPQKRFQFTHLPLPSPATLTAALPMAALLGLPLLGKSPRGRWWTGGAALAALALLAFGAHEVVHRTVWHSVRPLLPLAVLAGSVLLVRSDVSGASDSATRQRLFLLLAVASLVSLVQLPDAFPLYFGYSAPAIVLALLYVVRSQPLAPRGLHLVTLTFYALFATIWLHRSLPEAQGTRYWPVHHDTVLATDRGGLRMPRRMAGVYANLTAFVRDHSPEGSAIYATPDAPEVYFLTGRRNPTRTFFDFFEPDFGDPVARSRRLLALLDQEDVALVVFKQDNQFSGKVPDDLARGVAIRYPRHVERYPYTIFLRAAPQPGAEIDVDHRGTTRTERR